MTDVDKLVLEKFVPFRERIIGELQGKHPRILAVIDAVLAGRQNKVGMQVTEGGQVTGEYTFNLFGIRIIKTEPGKLEAELHHPLLGIIKPYVVIERCNLEKLIAAEPAFTDDLLAAVAGHLPDLTVKFMY